MLFLILAWRTWVPRVQDMFLSSSPGVNGYGSVCHEPCSKTNLFTSYFHWREGVPSSVLGSQPIIWLLPSSPGEAILLGLLDVTPVRLLLIQTSVGLHPDLHSFLTVCHCSFQREDSSHPTSIVSVGYHVTICNKILFSNSEKMPEKRMERFGLLLEHLTWIEHQFLCGIRGSKKAGSL